ncbi:hypothetical protein AGMMS49949_09820 [Alphaproteobacteria bacterium]|nr:hypothetical protein AGMMS49949_09820 [Alphaproteobacteria bacterium]
MSSTFLNNPSNSGGRAEDEDEEDEEKEKGEEEAEDEDEEEKPEAASPVSVGEVSSIVR